MPAKSNAERQRAQRLRGTGKDEVCIKVHRSTRDAMLKIKSGRTWDQFLTEEVIGYKS